MPENEKIKVLEILDRAIKSLRLTKPTKNNTKTFKFRSVSLYKKIAS